MRDSIARHPCQCHGLLTRVSVEAASFDDAPIGAAL